MEDRERTAIGNQTALAELGVGDEFSVGLVVGGSTVRTLELLGWEDSRTKYYVVVLEKDVLSDDQGLVTKVSINLVRKSGDSDFDPFAHVDSQIVGDRAGNRAKAVGSFSNMGIYSADLAEPHLAATGISGDKKNCLRAVLSKKDRDLEVAVKVDDVYKGIGVGEDLWVISMAILEALGVERRIVKVDATKGKKSGADYESFYERMGAKRLYEIEKGVLSEELVANNLWECSTKLSAGQFQRLKRILLSGQAS